jgi:hypothetical protein
MTVLADFLNADDRPATLVPLLPVLSRKIFFSPPPSSTNATNADFDLPPPLLTRCQLLSPCQNQQPLLLLYPSR